jgi:CheY-like chemotaxis protein
MGRILVVDDDAAFVEALSIYLEDQGLSVTSTTSGRRAVMESGRQHIDMVLVDVHLPDMDGLEVVARIRRLQPSVSFVLVSSDDSPEIIRKCSVPRRCVFMAKPLSPKKLLNRILHLVNAKKVRPKPAANRRCHVQ